MNIHAKLLELEASIEARAERMQDRLDKDFLRRDDMTQAQYDLLSAGIREWVKEQSSAIDILRTSYRASENTSPLHA